MGMVDGIIDCVISDKHVHLFSFGPKSGAGAFNRGYTPGLQNTFY